MCKEAIASDISKNSPNLRITRMGNCFGKAAGKSVQEEGIRLNEVRQAAHKIFTTCCLCLHVRAKDALTFNRPCMQRRDEHKPSRDEYTPSREERKAVNQVSVFKMRVAKNVHGCEHVDRLLTSFNWCR